jgi:hypothetical protein
LESIVNRLKEGHTMDDYERARRRALEQLLPLMDARDDKLDRRGLLHALRHRIDIELDEVDRPSMAAAQATQFVSDLTDIAMNGQHASIGGLRELVSAVVHRYIRPRA